MSGITTHILDTSLGSPAAGVRVTLEFFHVSDWQSVTEGISDQDGRVGQWNEKSFPIEKGIYRLTFDTGTYFKKLNKATFYPAVTIMFDVINSKQHYHVPLLLSSYGYSTYRGS